MMRYLFLLLFIPYYAVAQDISRNADELLSAYARQNKFSGNVLIAKKGQVIFEKSYGFADLESKKPNTLETEFRVGSLTKMFTSAIILQLAQQQQLSITDPLSKYVPQIPGGDSIQLIHLLGHTSGIRGNVVGDALKANAAVKQFKAEPAAFAPGSRFEYNNFNYILLTYIAEQITKKSLSDLIRQRILEKTNMMHSGMDMESRVSPNKAKGYVTNPESAEWVVANMGIVEVASGAGALYSTLHDLYNWSKAVNTGLVLPDSMMRLAREPRLNNYGLGWMTTEVFGRKQLGHTGSIPGFIANFMQFPDEDITIVLLSNYQDTDGRKLSQDLAAVALGEKYTLPVQKKEIALDMKVLSRYAGKYQLPDGFTITVTAENGQLFAQAQGDPVKVELTPESETKFFLKGPEMAIEFLMENNAVKYMYIDMQGGKKLVRM